MNISQVFEFQTLVNINYFRLYITFDCKSFDCNLPVFVRDDFLDISKACGTVWYVGIFHKTKCIRNKWYASQIDQTLFGK